MSRLSPSLKNQPSPKIIGWNATCALLVLVNIQPTNRTAFVKSAYVLPSHGTQSVNKFCGSGQRLLAGAKVPTSCDGFHELIDLKSMHHIKAEIAWLANSRVLFRVVLKELVDTLPQHTSHAPSFRDKGTIFGGVCKRALTGVFLKRL